MTPGRLFLAPCLLLLLAVGALAADGQVPLEGALQALASGDVAVRVRAAERLGRCRRDPSCARAARALERSLFDPAHPVRRAALAALVALKARASVGAVVRLLEVERHPQVLPAALLALGTLRAHGALARLLPFASHPDATVRAAALTAAGDLGGPEARRLVLNSLQMAGEEDPAWVVRATALLALARCGAPEDLGAARRAYEAGGGERLWLARSALAQVTAALDPVPRATLERLLGDPDPRVAVTAAAGLARAGQADVLLSHLLSAEPGIRAAAIGGVAQARLVHAYARLARMARWDPSRQVRWTAVLALFQADDPRGDDLMLDALGAAEPAVWVEALARLGRRTGAAHGRDAAAWRAELAQRRRRAAAGGRDGRG